MRILYVHPAEGFGGAERQGVLWISNLQRRGFHVIPVVGPGRPMLRALADAGVKDWVFCDTFVRRTAAPLGPAGRVGYHLEFVSAYYRTMQFLTALGRRHQVELVLASRSFSLAAASWAAMRLGVPFVWRAGSRPTRWIEEATLRLIRRLPIRPEAVICNCHAVKADVVPLLGCPSFMVPNGVDTERFDPRLQRADLRDVWEIAADAPLVGLAARPAPEKGLELLFDITRRAAQRLPALRVVVAGDFGWRGHYEAAAQRAGLGQRLRFVGHVDDIAAFYRSCDVVVLTSPEHSIEGAPNAVLEAMAMKRPVIATRVGGVPEVIRDGVDGLLIAPDDPGGFADLLLRVLSSPWLQRTLGAAARRRILANFSEPTASAELVAALEEIGRRTRRERRRASVARREASAARTRVPVSRAPAGTAPHLRLLEREP